MTVGILAGGGPFRRQRMISQQKGISQLRNGFWGLQNGTRVPRGGFAVVKNFAGGLVATKSCFGRFRNPFRRGTLFSQQNPNFAGWFFWLQNDFAGEAPFRNGALLAAKFLQEHKFLCFCAPLVPSGFPSLILKFLLILIIQKV